MLDMKEEKEKNAFFYWQIFAKIWPKNHDFNQYIFAKICQ
jgi:hypothetical protein